MLNPKDNELVSRVLASTRAGKRAWIPAGEANVFATAMLGKYLVSIRGPFFVQGIGQTYFMDIRTDDGAKVLTLSSEDYPDLAELHELARRQALKVDDAIDDILQDLGPE